MRLNNRSSKVNYLGATTESVGGWNKHRIKLVGNHNFVATDKYLTRTINTKVQILGNAYKIVYLLVERDVWRGNTGIRGRVLRN